MRNNSAPDGTAFFAALAPSGGGEEGKRASVLILAREKTVSGNCPETVWLWPELGAAQAKILKDGSFCQPAALRVVVVEGLQRLGP